MTWEGGVKSREKLVTSFMDGPLGTHIEISMYLQTYE